MNVKQSKKKLKQLENTHDSQSKNKMKLFNSQLKTQDAKNNFIQTIFDTQTNDLQVEEINKHFQNNFYIKNSVGCKNDNSRDLCNKKINENSEKIYITKC